MRSNPNGGGDQTVVRAKMSLETRRRLFLPASLLAILLVAGAWVRAAQVGTTTWVIGASIYTSIFALAFGVGYYTAFIRPPR